jgi:mono/diheme cytochrome c family protein
MGLDVPARRGIGVALAAALSLAALSASSALAAEEADAALLERGKALFVQEAAPPCGVCHTLADAGTAGQIGPKLEEMKPDVARVKAAVTDGVGVMPPYGGTMSADDISAVALYVATATGGAVPAD